MNLKLNLLFLLFTTSLFAQNTKYIDVDGKEIDKRTYHKKDKSFIFFTNHISSDSVDFKILFPHFKFGKLNTKELSEVKTYLKKNFSKEINDSSTIAIQYLSNLDGYSKYSKLYPLKRNIPGHGTVNIPYSIKYYNSKRKYFDSIYGKCKKTYKSKNIIPLHIYQNNNNYEFKNKHVNWQKSTTFLNSKFFKWNRGFLILRPNGEYYLEHTFDAESYTSQILNMVDWSGPNRDVNIMISENKKKRIGFFKPKYRKKEVNKIPLIPNTYLIDRPAYIKQIEKRRMANLNFGCFERMTY